MKDREEKERELQQYYFRVKRHKSTLFVTASGSDKVSQLKKEIIKQLGIDVKIKLYRADNSNPPNFTSLESQSGEDPTIAKLGLADEQILYLVFWDDKNERFENVSFELPEPLPDEEEEEEDIEHVDYSQVTEGYENEIS